MSIARKIQSVRSSFKSERGALGFSAIGRYVYVPVLLSLDPTYFNAHYRMLKLFYSFWR